MKTIWSGLLAVVSLLVTPLALAGYADDRAEIENISNKYMVAVDSGDIDLVMSTWADDGVLEWVFGVEHGKDEIFKAMSGFGGARYEAIPEGATSRPRTRHQIINHVIDVEGDTATTTAYWFAFTNRTPQGDVQLLYFGHYEDILQRRDGKWLFTSRKVYNESRDNKKLWYPELGEIDPRTRKPPTP
ncbi:MAG: nuclear transport factor 2 family protein [Pseudomonadota bacterium]